MIAKFYCQVIFGAGNYKNYGDRRDCKALVSLFKDDLFRKFVILLAGYRPDFFICLTKCALMVHKNIFAHHVNTISYYNKSADGKTQNKSVFVKKFLENLNSLDHTDIDFDKFKNFYVTYKQMNTLGNFVEASTDFWPSRKWEDVDSYDILIFRQMKTRKGKVEKGLHCGSWNEVHRKVLREFV